MSGLLAGKVWQSNLDGTLKPLAACLADIANDDGTRIFPSHEYICWLMGKSPRAIQYQLRKLEDMGVLEVVAEAGGRTGAYREYRMDESKLPRRKKWQLGAKTAPTKLGAKKDELGATSDELGAKDDIPSSYRDPSLDPSKTLRARAERIVKPRRPNQEPPEPKIKCPPNILERYGEIYEMFANDHDRAGLERIAKTWLDYRLGQPRDRRRTSEQWYHDFLSWVARQKPTKNGNGQGGRPSWMAAEK